MLEKERAQCASPSCSVRKALSALCEPLRRLGPTPLDSPESFLSLLSDLVTLAAPPKRRRKDPDKGLRSNLETLDVGLDSGHKVTGKLFFGVGTS